MKRNVMSNKIQKGGYNMTNIDCFFDALKISWICRILNQPGKWKTVLNHYIEKIGLSLEYLLLMNFKNTLHFPVILKIPKFYQDIFTCFNKVKDIKPLARQNDDEFLSEPLFGNELFKCNDKCIYFPNWIKSGIKLVKHLVTNDGHLSTDEEIYNKIQRKINIISEIFIIKNILMPWISKCELSLAHGVQECKDVRFLHGNKIFVIKDQSSKFFYELLASSFSERNYMEQSLSLRFRIPNEPDIWESIYTQKIKTMYITKLAEFNFKILHNILPCGMSLSKWQKDVSVLCEFCKKPESVEHMLLECIRVQDIWTRIAPILQMNIRWKTLICGFIMRDLTPKLEFYNLILTLVMYAIFRQNSKCKFEKTSYMSLNLKLEVKKYLQYYKNLLQLTSYGIFSKRIFDDIIDAL